MALAPNRGLGLDIEAGLTDNKLCRSSRLWERVTVQKWPIAGNVTERTSIPYRVRTKGKIVTGRDIFISYSREERAAARHFAESFTREGFTVWWDAALRSGQTFDEVIERELRAAKAVIVLWSPRSVASRWVRAEATLADRSNKLVPVIIEACDRPIIFELTQASDLADWTGDPSDHRWQTLISDLRRLVGMEEDEEPLSAAPMPAPSPRPASPPRKIASAEPAKEEVIAALARISTPVEPELLKPTEQEEQMTQFYRQSDEFRAQEGNMVHCLLRLDEEQSETTFVVGPTGLKMGRSAPADIIISGLGVSRAHCEVELVGDQLRVTDLNSTNGTFVDDKRIERSAILPKGAVLRVGGTSFRHDVFSRAEFTGQTAAAGVRPPAGPPAARYASS